MRKAWTAADSARRRARNRPMRFRADVRDHEAHEYAQLRATEPAGAFVLACLYVGCPLSSTEQGAAVNARVLVGKQRSSSSALTVRDVERLSRWCDWVVAVAGYLAGEVSVERAAEAATLARLVGCDLSAWAPRGVGGVA